MYRTARSGYPRLAEIAFLSQFHFARAFKAAAVGKSLHQYVSAHWVERAKEQLVRGDQSLLVIAGDASP
jgi:AraC family transcriptional regulator